MTRDLNAFPEYPDCMPGEEWRPIPNCSRYEISNMGRVRSWCVERSKKLRSTPHIKVLGIMPNRGIPYHQILLVNDQGKTIYWHVSRLVMHCFVGPCPQGKEVAHNNGNSLDDRLSNLRYASRLENLMDCKHILTADQVREIRAARKNGESINSICKRYGRSRSSIFKLVGGRTFKELAEAV